MHMYSERMQVLLSPEQRDRLERVAKDRRSSVGAVIREAIEAHVGSSQRTRDEAFKKLIGLNAPVDDWPVMKAQIEQAYLAEIEAGLGTQA